MKFLPGRHAIDAFGNGGFRFAGMSHLGSLVILPSGMRACSANSFAEVGIADLQLFIDEKSEIDFLLIGTGRDMRHLPPSLSKILNDASLNYDCMNTNATVRTYNTILAEDRRVAALMIAVP